MFMNDCSQNCCISNDKEFRQEVTKFQKNRIMISSSFFGLEEPILLPPNIHLTGPNIDPDQEHLKTLLGEKDPKLLKFLDDAHSRK